MARDKVTDTARRLNSFKAITGNCGLANSNINNDDHAKSEFNLSNYVGLPEHNVEYEGNGEVVLRIPTDKATEKLKGRQNCTWRHTGRSTAQQQAELIARHNLPEYSSHKVCTFLAKLALPKNNLVGITQFHTALVALLHDAQPLALYSGATLTDIYNCIQQTDRTAAAVRFLFMMNTSLFVVKCQM